MVPDTVLITWVTGHPDLSPGAPHVTQPPDRTHPHSPEQTVRTTGPSLGFFTPHPNPPTINHSTLLLTSPSFKRPHLIAISFHPTLALIPLLLSPYRTLNHLGGPPDVLPPTTTTITHHGHETGTTSTHPTPLTTRPFHNTVRLNLSVHRRRTGSSQTHLPPLTPCVHQNPTPLGHLVMMNNTKSIRS